MNISSHEIIHNIESIQVPAITVHVSEPQDAHGSAIELQDARERKITKKGKEYFSSLKMKRARESEKEFSQMLDNFENKIGC